VSQFALFQYYKKFIPAFSDIAKPLQALLKEKTPFKWTAACDEAHERMKTTFSCKISLHLPTSQDTFHLHTDASSYAAAAVLSQVQKEGSVPIAFYSKAFDETQMRYSILDKELYAMVNAIKHFEFYLQGRKFKIFTDSKILYYLREAKESNPKLMRWSLLLQDYDFDITHISGKSNKIADILSRVSHNQEEDVSRRIHTAKKEILQKIRDQVEEMDIPNGMTLSMSEMNTMVVANTSHQHQAGALLQHHFHRLHDPMFATAAKTKPKLNVFINSLEDVQEDEDNHMSENHHYTSWELLLAATSFQAGNMSLPDFRKLQEQDEYCTKIKRLAETDQIAKHFHVRQGILPSYCQRYWWT